METQAQGKGRLHSYAEAVKQQKLRIMAFLGLAASVIGGYEVLGKGPGIEHGFSRPYFEAAKKYERCAALSGRLTLQDNQRPLIKLSELSPRQKNDCQVDQNSITNGQSAPQVTIEDANVRLPSANKLHEAANVQIESAHTMEGTDRVLAGGVGGFMYVMLVAGGVGLVNSMRRQPQQ